MEEPPTAIHDIRAMINKCTWCVKVFVTSPDGNWWDCGTGMLGFYRKNLTTGLLNYFDPNLVPQKPSDNPDPDVGPGNPLFIGVTKKIDKLGHNESITADEDVLFRIRGNREQSDFILYASMEQAYDFDRQERNIISWHQSDMKEELALSFLEPYVCLQTWTVICGEMGKEVDDLLPFATKETLDSIIAQLESTDTETRGIVLNIYSKQAAH